MSNRIMNFTGEEKKAREEYPRPQFVRQEWMNLNGEWEFEFDFGKSGIDRKLFEGGAFTRKIQVPFCPESSLSGIEYKDFMNMVWYRRSFSFSSEVGKRVLLHFQAVDYHARVWINGKKAGEHKGGYTPFTIDITDYVTAGDNTVTLCAEDDVRSATQARGKQCEQYFSSGCDYTRTTGIWQTVWLEFVPESYLNNFKFYPNASAGLLNLQCNLKGAAEGAILKAEAYYKGKLMGKTESLVLSNEVELSFSLLEKYLWMPGEPNLYDLKVSLWKGESKVDEVVSYFGLRDIYYDKEGVRINGKKIYQRLVLDQGFYPEGIYTAPSDEALKNDILLSMEMGFNGARLHEKVFEPRFLYWADHLGYLVWGEYGNWGLDITKSTALAVFLPEWLEAVTRDFNSTALVGWCPFNETWDQNSTRQEDSVLRIIYEVTKAIDGTRPVIDTSGNFHVVTDIFDIHDYEQEEELFAEKFKAMGEGGETYVTFPDRQSYNDQAYFVSEYGGIWWSEADSEGWGYGKRPGSREEFLKRYKSLTTTLLRNKRISGFCYTQLYDVEQEVNGLYTYNREAKFDPVLIREINEQKAAIEE
jgi:beta-galactosidase/beta-glucuronidase